MSRNPVEQMKMPDQLYHWVPGEMVVVLRLPRHVTEDAHDMLIEQVRSQLNASLAPYSLTLELYGTHGRWHETPSMPPVRRRSFVFGLHLQQPYVAIFFHACHHDETIQDPVPMTLSYLQGQLDQLTQVGLSLVSAMPNWLVTAAPAFYGDGGPALPPLQAPALDLPTAGNPPVGWHISFVDSGLALDVDGADGIMVAVLDTAQHPDRLRSAAARPELRRNWLLQRLATNLRSESGSFEIEYDRYPVTDDINTGRDLNGDPAYYPMQDHGIFVAGLIRDIAPRARIRVIRILNDFGGGDLYNLFAALTDLEQELHTGTIQRLVINLSLTIMPDLRRLPYIWFEDREWPSTQLVGVMRALTHIETGLQLLFECLQAQGALVVAAAGNDSLATSKQGQWPRPPRAPARYATTLGVTSVNSRFVPSRFANAASIAPVDTGVATFGGDYYGSKDANELPDAVRGVYISPTFPDGEQNTTGWADWCGSSFSTAIISALGAHLMAQGLSAPSSIYRITAGPERRADKLFGVKPAAPNVLANIVRVQQRFGM
jgi:hypothetical protein